jgi:hypothetical protein
MSVVVAPEVAAALARCGAVVTLESTIICHGQLAPAFSFWFPIHSPCRPLLASFGASKLDSIRFHGVLHFP